MVRRNPVHLAASIVGIAGIFGVEGPLMGQVCTGMCDRCWIGTDRENNCDPAWNGAYDGCDCGCQFCDPDCHTTMCDFCYARCDHCWLGQPAENNCPWAWHGTGDGCDCGCQFVDPDCHVGPVGACCSSYVPSDCFNSVMQVECRFLGFAFTGSGVTCTQVDCSARCDHLDLPCDFCWLGTPAYNDCLSDWRDADDGCDCGCQWDDPDCHAPVGACCDPDLHTGECIADITHAECLAQFAVGGASVGEGVSCSQANCPHRCLSQGPACDYCWLGTTYENNCPGQWLGPTNGCDCGCQWTDPECSDIGVGACCDPYIPSDVCLQRITQPDCLDAEMAYVGDGTDCDEVDCSGRCNHLGSTCAFCALGTPYENACPISWRGADDGCDCGCQWLDPDCGPCPDGVCGPEENPCTCPQDCPGCCTAADCEDGRYCNGVESCDGSNQCLPGSSVCPPNEWCIESSHECLAAGDADRDGDSDLVDCSTFQACFGGSANSRGAGPTPTWCEDVFDRDGDGDVDLDDYVIFHGHIAGPAR